MNLPPVNFAALAHDFDCAVQKERRAFDVFEAQAHQLVRGADDPTKASIERMREATADEITESIALYQLARDWFESLSAIEPEIRRLLIRKANRVRRVA